MIERGMVEGRQAERRSGYEPGGLLENMRESKSIEELDSLEEK
jgi:hypothetical protein